MNSSSSYIINCNMHFTASSSIGRLTGRLPQELADEVVGSIMQLFTIVETDAAWHGGKYTGIRFDRRTSICKVYVSHI